MHSRARAPACTFSFSYACPSHPPITPPAHASANFANKPWFDNPNSIPNGRNPGPGFVNNSGNAPFKTCSCCSANYSQTLSQGGEGAIYGGFSYTCPGRPISAKCLFYLQAQEADFACNPATQSLYYTAAIPLCSIYVQAWYSACADQYTCKADWVNWPLDATGRYQTCAQMGQSCQTYANMYKDATNMTVSMWPTVYTVSSDTAVWCVPLAAAP